MLIASVSRSANASARPRPVTGRQAGCAATALEAARAPAVREARAEVMIVSSSEARDGAERSLTFGTRARNPGPRPKLSTMTNRSLFPFLWFIGGLLCGAVGMWARDTAAHRDFMNAYVHDHTVLGEIETNKNSGRPLPELLRQAEEHARE
ncbi:hypothetical protein [Rhizosaccharibacter radicis]|uniref:Uncharacterized protein n=1 Tax=Rhizosaccharibacter radicis TaxID=2782605 RepID=A0ABT1VT82_9PROT|nr:hypothetical protein [Acetobacteraceae bacterium KSS12]